MALYLKIAIVVLFVGVAVRADEIVQPPLLPSDTLLPQVSNLIDKNQQNHDTATLQNISNALEQTLMKQDNNQQKTDKKSLAQPLENKKNSTAKKKFYAQERLQAITTQFLRAPEFSKPITIKIKKIALREALFIIAKQAGVHFLVDHDVTGYAPSLQAELIPVSALLQMLLDSHKPELALIRIAGAWRVVARSKAEQLLQSIIQGDDLADRVVEKIIIKNAPWNDRLKESIQQLWRGVVGDSAHQQETYIVFDDSANQLIFSARSTQAARFKELVTAIDQASPQVRLDMRIIIANKNFESDFGLKWSGLYDRRYWAGKFGLAGLGVGATTPVSTIVQGPLNPNPPSTVTALPALIPLATSVAGASDIFSNMLGWVLNAIPVSLAAKKNDAISMSLPITLGGRNLEWGRLNLQLMAAEQNLEIKTILKPTLLVNNLETAEILVGQQLPHSIKVQESIQGTLVNANSTAYKDVGTKIQVRSVVMNALEQVALDIFLEHSYITALQQTALLAAPGDARGQYNYSLETARTRNKVILKSGQTTMIGGLMVNTYEYMESGIPFLKDIPVLGALFRGRSKVMLDKQILIFITPTLVSCDKTTENSLPQDLLYNNEVA